MTMILTISKKMRPLDASAKRSNAFKTCSKRKAYDQQLYRTGNGRTNRNVGRRENGNSKSILDRRKKKSFKDHKTTCANKQITRKS